MKYSILFPHVADRISYGPQEELSLLEEYMLFIAGFYKSFRFSS